MRAVQTSGTIARDRLEHMLLSDKMQLDPELTAQMKRELRSVIRKYIGTGQVRLDLCIQVRSAGRQGEENVKTIQIKGL